MVLWLQFVQDGLSADPKKVEAIVKTTTSQNVAQLRSFFGLANYCARFTTVPSKLRNDRFFRRFVSDSFVIYEGHICYLVITIRCKRRVKNCKFQFDSSDS